MVSNHPLRVKKRNFGRSCWRKTKSQTKEANDSYVKVSAVKNLLAVFNREPWQGNLVHRH